MSRRHDPAIEKHVVVIQSAWRGALARAEVDAMRAEAAERSAEQDSTGPGDPAQQHVIVGVGLDFPESRV